MKYQLELTKWRCGLNEDILVPRNLEETLGRMNLGRGPTSMKNNIGYSCCLGQFAEGKVSEDALKGGNAPGSVSRISRTRYDPVFLEEQSQEHPHGGVFWNNNRLGVAMMNANDAKDTTVREKIKTIRNLLANEKHELEVLYNGEVVEV